MSIATFKDKGLMYLKMIPSTIYSTHILCIAVGYWDAIPLCNQLFVIIQFYAWFYEANTLNSALFLYVSTQKNPDYIIQHHLKLYFYRHEQPIPSFHMRVRIRLPMSVINWLFSDNLYFFQMLILLHKPYLVKNGSQNCLRGLCYHNNF